MHLLTWTFFYILFRSDPLTMETWEGLCSAQYTSLVWLGITVHNKSPKVLGLQIILALLPVSGSLEAALAIIADFSLLSGCQINWKKPR